MSTNYDDLAARAAVPVVTDLAAGTLSEEDRELFLQGRGLVPGISEAKAVQIRAEWQDEDILMAIGCGLF